MEESGNLILAHHPRLVVVQEDEAISKGMDNLLESDAGRVPFRDWRTIASNCGEPWPI
jgi:hypothetical protein